MNIRTILLFAVSAFMLTSCGAQSDGGSSSSESVESGQGGSMSRFAIAGSNLYTLNSPAIYKFDISKPTEIRYLNEGMIASDDGETIFVRDSLLYIGSQSGMHILELQNLKRLSSISHFVSCDPVVVLDTFAYVTLSTGNTCRWNITPSLMLYSVKNPLEPKEITGYTYTMTNPRGLAIRDSLLFVCDDGLKIYYAKHPADSLPRLKHIADMDGYDVILRDTTILLIGDDGFYQYSYRPYTENGRIEVEINLLSKILAQGKK
jgi:hypothetical protein